MAASHHSMPPPRCEAVALHHVDAVRAGGEPKISACPTDTWCDAPSAESPQSGLAMCPEHRLSHGEEEHRRAHPGRDGADTDVTSKPGRRSRHFQRSLSGRRRRSRRARTRVVGERQRSPHTARRRPKPRQRRAPEPRLTTSPGQPPVRWTEHVPGTCRREDPDRIHPCLSRPNRPSEPNRSRPAGGDVGLCTA